MRVAIFCHSLRSCWNHGNAHFLRGVCSEILDRGHELTVLEPEDAWSVQNLVADHGPNAVNLYREAYPQLKLLTYNRLDSVGKVLDEAELVLVHEWNDHDLVAEIGDHHKQRGGYRLLFHDTHHRAATQPEAMAAYDLSGYDGVLAFGQVISDLYVRNGWAKRAWTWHEAADPRVFHPLPTAEKQSDLVWIGNWGDDERAAELREFLIDPVRELGLKAKVYGVRYPKSAIEELNRAGIEYGGWLPNHRAPEVFAQHLMTVHVPRRPYVEALPGIPTIRVFEALACGIPLISAPWRDSEGLFRQGDFFLARDGAEMKRQMKRVLDNPAEAARVAATGRETVLARHTVAHRVDELMRIAGAVAQETSVELSAMEASR